MFVEIVFVGLPIDRDEVEEALESEFEVTGAGSGMGRCHLDVEIVEGSDTTAAAGGVVRPGGRGLCDLERDSFRMDRAGRPL
ncbi:hypothetical protein ACIA2T_12910 [Amycolatopsis japonica]|uniref:hypothetical protein n=1 Tax=Amycolatopsis japonica TaxID=208439 RepID=UPI00378E2151